MDISNKMKSGEYERVIVLGMDGLDPSIMERLMGAGELPGFVRLSEMGCYCRLTTSNPAQSPVAWSTIATGKNPGHHAVFDFIRRDPERHLPELSIMRLNPSNILLRRDSMFLPVRKCDAFWTIASRAGIPVHVIRWPLTLPPEEISGSMLSGLGVPDIRANLGRYTLYTTREIKNAEEMKGDVLTLSSDMNSIETVIIGPGNSRTPAKIHVDRSSTAVSIIIEDREYRVKEGQWSDWIHMRVHVSFLKKIHAIGRFYLKSISPELELYLSPLQVDPADPTFFISYPEDYSKRLSEEIGCFHTIGMPEDTNAMNDGFLDEEAFLQSCKDVMAEREKMLWYELTRFRQGVLACVFDTTDRIQHMFWETNRGIIDDYYRRMDRILGKVLDTVDKKALLMVLSDHGFTSFRRSLHVNSVLVRNELMALEGDSEGSRGLFEGVDWRRTKAYALGYTSIYVNLRGREKWGIVGQGEEAMAVKKKIMEILLGLRDPEDGKPMINSIYDGGEIYSGPHAKEAPDLIIGFHPGYRASWQTAVGGVPEGIVEDNKKKWSGDHIVDFHLIPGIFLTNIKLRKKEMSVMDIAPLILDCFGLYIK